MASSISEITPTPGTCFVCGCTEERACPTGCAWVDPDNLVCSTCADALGSLALGFLFVTCAARAVAAVEPSGIVVP